MAPLPLGLAITLALAQAPPRPDPAALKARVARGLPLVRQMASDAAVVSAVVAQDARRQSLEDVKRLDREWTATRGTSELIRKHLDSPCARALRALAAKEPAVVEAFAMDDQGALVCTLAKTTDYWQGDEAKWQRSFASGRGAEFVDDPQFDESAQSYCIQVSVPVKDGGRVVGAITVGFDLDRLDAKPQAKQAP
ncbi:MAG TPA: PDC sensor domain-containing protein [Myxococcales bacterium]|jgi:hypothetical protein|nr:PDC sensor domain-containing protein [Myxococcales bacterium]